MKVEVFEDDRSGQLKRLLRREQIRRQLATLEMLPFVQLINGDEYQSGWVHEDLCQLLDAFVEAVEKQQAPRLMVWIPPRHGKSQIISKAFPCFLLGQHPDWEIVNATYGQDLATDMGDYVRGIMNDPLYKELFPDTVLDPSTNAKDDIGTFRLSKTGSKIGSRKGGYKAVGVGTALTGRGARVMIIDDPVKDRQEADSEQVRRTNWNWYSSTARTRLAPGGGVIVLQTRWHEEDLSGMILEQAKKDPNADQWHVYSFPAIATKDEYNHAGVLRRRKGEALHPERFSLKELQRTKASLHPRDWSALYQQNPTPDDGSYFQRAWFKQWGKECG